MASSAHVYPEIVNGQAAIGVAERLVEGLLPAPAEAGSGGMQPELLDHAKGEAS